MSCPQNLGQPLPLLNPSCPPRSVYPDFTGAGLVFDRGDAVRRLGCVHRLPQHPDRRHRPGCLAGPQLERHHDGQCRQGSLLAGDRAQRDRAGARAARRDRAEMRHLPHAHGRGHRPGSRRSHPAAGRGLFSAGTPPAQPGPGWRLLQPVPPGRRRQLRRSRRASAAAF